MGTSTLNISNNWLLHIAAHFFTKSVSWRFIYNHYRRFWVHGAPKEVYTSEKNETRGIWTRSISWFSPRVRKSRYGGETLQSPIHCYDVTKPPYLFSGELCTSPLQSKRLFVYTVCCRRRGQCFAVHSTRKSDVILT